MGRTVVALAVGRIEFQVCEPSAAPRWPLLMRTDAVLV